MTIAIDYDGTFTKDPLFFDDLVTLVDAYSHQAVLVTSREDRGAMGDDVREAVGNIMPIVFAGSRPKREAAREAGFRVDVWIDDMPETIGAALLVGNAR